MGRSQREKSGKKEREWDATHLKGGVNGIELTRRYRERTGRGKRKAILQDGFS